MTRLLLLAPALFITACATAAGQEPPANIAGECRNDALAQFAGQPANADTGAAILRASGARTLQWIGPDEMVTMEFSAERVRVHTDPANRIVSARCG